MINKIIICKETRKVKYRDRRLLGIKGENLQDTLLFCLDEDVDGEGVLEIEFPDGNKDFVDLERVEEGWQLVVKSILLDQIGYVKFQLRILQDKVEVFKSLIFEMEVKESLNAIYEEPEEYPTWLDNLESLKSDLEKSESERVSNENERISEEETRQKNFTEMQETISSAVSNIKDLTDKYNENDKQKTEAFNKNFEEKQKSINDNAETKTKAFDDNAEAQTKTFNTNSDDKLAEYNQNHTDKMQEFNDNFDTKTKTFNNNATAKLDEYNKNDKAKLEAYNANDIAKTKAYNDNTVLKEKAYNDNATSKTETFNSNATDKQNEFDENAANKLAEYNQNAEELINKIEQVQTENEALKAENKLIKEQIPSANMRGNSIHIEDSGTLDFDWKINGGHRQETREGYQLLESYDFSDTTINNLSCAIKEDGKIVLNGTPSKEVDIVIKKETTYKKGTYTFVINQLPTNAVVCIFNSGWQTLNQLSTSKLKGTFTLQEDAIVRIHIYIRTESGNLSNYILEPMLYEGEYDENKKYEEYGATPSLEFPAEIAAVGNNINYFDENAISESTYINGGNGSNYGKTGSTQITNTSDYMKVEKGKQYIFHYDYDNLLNNTDRGYVFFDEDKNVIVSSSSTLYSVTSKKLVLKATQDGFVRISYDKNCTDIKFEEGSKKTPYSSYNQGSIQENVTNGNLLDFNVSQDSRVTVNGDGTLTLNGSGGFRLNIAPTKILEGTKFYQKVELVSGQISGVSINATFLCLEGNGKWISSEAFTESSFNEDTEATGIWINASAAFDNVVIKLWMNTDKSDFVKHQSQTAIMPLQQELLEGDYISDVEHHEWGKLALTGNEGFALQKNANELNYFYLNYNLVKAKGNIISNMLKKAKSREIWDKTSYEDLVLTSDNKQTINIMLSDTTITTLQQFKEKLKELYDAGKPLILYFELATPVDLELTEEQQAVRNTKLYTYKNITNISVSDELASIDVEYKKDPELTEKNIEDRLAALEAASIS